MVKVLLTGGAGYIGSHTYVALVNAGFDVVILDSFENAKDDVPARLERITAAPVTVYRGDVRDESLLSRIFSENAIEAVVHFAAKKAVGESVAKPLDYFQANIGGLLILLSVMRDYGTKAIVFSSSATVYGDTNVQPIPEDHARTFTSPYAFTKITGEHVLEQLAASDPLWRIGILRYFNPVGAHKSALIGEDPNDVPSNLVPFVAKVATGELDRIRVFGNDYPTPDGTGVRDYIHVEDLAEGHVASLRALLETGKNHAVNLGTGTGSTVLEVIAAYGTACGKDLPYEIVERRDGDVAYLIAQPEKAREILGFEAKRSLDDMCRSSWAWVSGQIANS